MLFDLIIQVFSEISGETGHICGSSEPLMFIYVVRTKIRLKILYSMTFCLLGILHKMSNKFWTPKLARAYVCMKISENPPFHIHTNIHAQSNPCQFLKILLETGSKDDLRATTSRVQVIAALTSRQYDTCN